MVLLKHILAFAIITWWISSATVYMPVSYAEDAYTFGVFPFLPPARLEQRMGELALMISHALQRPVYFRTKSEFGSFTKQIEAESYDIIFLQPFDYVETAEKHGYLPLVKIAAQLTAIFVVKEDSELESLDDLEGKILGMPPAAAAVSRLSLAALAYLGPDIEIKRFRSHPGCLQAVLIGQVHVCATNAIPLRVFLSNSTAEFRVIGESTAIPHVLVVVRKNFPQGERNAIQRVFIELADSSVGRAWLVQSGMESGFIAAQDSDYNIVRSLPAYTN